jgi:Mrp family chromosome partitioning ATPase
LAAQDLIISRRSPAGSSAYLDSDPSAGDPVGPDGAAVLFSTLRSRWLLLVVIGVVSAGLASLAAWQFSKKTAVVKAAIIYMGLPNAASNNNFDPLGAATGAEMITSVKVLKQLCDKRGLDMPAARMADYITAGVGRSSSYINLSLAWADVDEGIDMLNDLTGVFIEEMTSQRKAILKQNLQHLEMTLLQAKGRVDDARSQLNELQNKQNDQLSKGGLTSEQYRTALSSAGIAKSKVDDKITEQTAINAQITEVKAKISATEKKQHDLEGRVKEELLRQAQAVLTKARDGWAAGSPTSQQINQTYNTIAQFIKSPTAPKEFDEWQQKLVEILQGTSNGLSDANRKKLDEAFAGIEKAHDFEFKELDTQRHKLEEQRDQMQLNLISVENQINTLQRQRAEYEKKAESLGEQITGISANQLDEAKHLLDEAEKQQDSLTVQRDTIRQLSESRLREWTVTVPASAATAQIDSNRAKLFVLVFGLCCFALSAPLFVAEWHAQTGTPQVQMARSLRVPVLAERILEHFSPHARHKEVAAGLSADDTETLRMLTLRIQQSCHRPGSVILFSSLDPKFSAAPLMATVAECLAEREERVLLIDAVCPQRSLLSVLNVLSPSAIPALPAPKKSKRSKAALPPTPTPTPVAASAATATSGLSEYLSEECEDLGELVQATGCPGVDLIASGRRGFSREAMASSCLTQLLNTCRKNYTMVLVHGPAVDCAADLQMLTARADGIVLAATKESGKDPRARAFVEDLLELGAPLIGLVA